MSEANKTPEDFVVERTKLGEFADFTVLPDYDAKALPKVSASLIRSLLLGFKVDSDGQSIVRAPGVRVRGAHIEGKLDLTDCGGGDGLPPLILEACELPCCIDISGSRIARLSVAKSKFREIQAEGAQIDGDLDFAFTSPLPNA